MNNFEDLDLDVIDDYGYIYKKSKNITSYFEKHKLPRINIKIAILSVITIADTEKLLNMFLTYKGFNVDFWIGNYNSYYAEAFNNKSLEDFKPDIIYIHSNVNAINHYPDLSYNKEDVKKLLLDTIEPYKQTCHKLLSKFNCRIILNNFELTSFRLLGNYEGSSFNGKTNFIRELNLQIINYISENSNILLNDIEFLSAKIGNDNWINLDAYFKYKQPFSIQALIDNARNISNIISSIYGKTKKALILDLDDTLWGGTIGDDGIENIHIGNSTALGESHHYFQSFIKPLIHKGVALAVSSKNDHNIATEGLQKNEMILKNANFNIIKANWLPKSHNILEVAQELNINTEACLFIDNSPFEQGEVRENIKNISVPYVKEQPISFIQHISNGGYFETTIVSEDDFKRNQYFKENQHRKKIEKSYSNYDEYLNALNMVDIFNEWSNTSLTRVEQLLNKTNQFNLNPQKYKTNDILEIFNSQDKIGIYGILQDKLGDNGIVSIMIIDINNNLATISNWVMSCRVFNRNFEYRMFEYIQQILKNKNIKLIKGIYNESAKNQQFAELYSKLGFHKDLKNNCFTLEIV